MFFCVFAMMGVRVFLVVAVLLSCCAGKDLTDSVSKIWTSAGQSVILPCNISVSVHDDVPSVEWSKEGLKPNIAFLYRDGCETFSEKNPVFNYRTNLIMDELKNGNLSLRISTVQRSDAGKYTCKTFRGRPQEIATVELSVGEASEPKLSRVSVAGDGVTLQCEANCWFPKPEIMFLDVQGNVIRAEDTKTHLDSRCFTATRRATVQTANRVTCRVHQPEINETRVTEINIPDECIRSCTHNTIIAVAVTMILCGLTALICKKCGHSVGGHEMHKSPTHSNVEGRNPGDHADRVGNASTEHVMSNLHDNEEIRRLTEELNHLRSKQCVAVDSSPSKSSTDISKPTNPDPDQSPQSNHPKAATSTNGNRPKPGKKDFKHAVSIHIPASVPETQRSSPNHGSPTPLTDSVASSAFPSDATHVGRSMSMSESRPRPNIAKTQRRYSTSGLSNRFSPLENLSEDVEPLL
ncbi:uncharacterized protein LOC116053402 [Sander lucioperca]|uniref:Uncharacterized LOC116053402 n=1 Tax=Sander lucioperca TaxID=283035 RepID=A0A8C9WYK5_SANLU|nr:uncharacterized protein LOC116053402 [Sander lucioperca]